MLPRQTRWEGNPWPHGTADNSGRESLEFQVDLLRALRGGGGGGQLAHLSLNPHFLLQQRPAASKGRAHDTGRELPPHLSHMPINNRVAPRPSQQIQKNFFLLHASCTASVPQQWEGSGSCPYKGEMPTTTLIPTQHYWEVSRIAAHGYYVCLQPQT